MAKLGLAPVVSGSAARIVAIGDLTARTTAAIEQAVNELLTEGITSLAVDLRRAEVVEPEAVDLLLALAGRVCTRGVAVELCADGETRERLEAAKVAAFYAAVDEALAMAESVRTLLDVRESDGTDPSAVDAVTWIATDEPSVPTS